MGRLTRPAKALWHAGTPNFRVLALTGMLWTVPQSLTEPYRFLFCHRLGLSEGALGLLVAADLVLRATGLILSGWAMRRVGAKRLLIIADLLSWVAPFTLLSTAGGPLQAGAALVLMSLNAFASTPYLCLLAEGAPRASRSRAFAFLALCNILPSALLPWIAADLAESRAFLPTLRTLLGLQAGLMATGILVRAAILSDLPTEASSGPGLRHVARTLLRSRAFRIIWPLLVLQGAQQAAWNAWSAIWLTGPLGLPDRAPGWNAQIGAAALALASFALMPRLRESSIPKAAAIALAASFASSLAWLLPLSLWTLLVVGAIQGACTGVHASALSSILAGALPRNSRDHGFALSYVGVHLCVSGLMVAAGMFLHGRSGALPWILVAVALAQALAGARLPGLALHHADETDSRA